MKPQFMYKSHHARTIAIFLGLPKYVLQDYSMFKTAARNASFHSHPCKYYVLILVTTITG